MTVRFHCVPQKEIGRFTGATGVPGLRALRPVIPAVGSGRWVEDHAEREAKRLHPRLWAAVKALGTYIQREEHYDFPLYDVRHLTADPGFAFYLWLERNACCGAYNVLGGASFQRDWYSNLPRVWVLMWVWVFPEHRGHGLLSRAWPGFAKRHGPIVVQTPISEGFDRFLDHRPSVLIPTTETDKASINVTAYVFKRKRVAEVNRP